MLNCNTIAKTNETLDIIKDNWINSWGVYPNLGLSEPEPDGEIEEKVQETDFIDKLDHALARHPDVASELLELEILETSALETFQTAEIVTITSQQLGVTFALDDFGTGYSSLSYLRQLPVKTLKIDQTFVRDILDDIEDRAIIEAIVELAKVFKLNVIAEGVETKQQAQLLVELGCEVAQGYGISKPMPAGEVLDWCKHYVPTLDS